MGNTIDIRDIRKLHRIHPSEWEYIVQMMLRAFRDYPKLCRAFPDFADRQAGIEAVLRYYGAFDMYYGAGFSLDEDLREAVLLMHSRDMEFSEERIWAAGCESEGWRRAMQRLTPDQRQTWFDLFEALDREEAKLDLPDEYIYADFLAVDPDYQRQGRGRRLIRTVCDYADSMDLPIMLFTNTEEDVAFYESSGFRVIGITDSEEYGFNNTYVLREPVYK